MDARTTSGPVIHDWHNPHNDDCAQNADPARDCTCRRQLTRRAYTKRLVHDNHAPAGVATEIIVEIHKNGTLVFREKGRRTRYEATAGELYAALMWKAARKAAADKRAARRARKGGR